MKFTYYKHILKFNFAAGTSRGVYHEKPTWIIKIEADNQCGYGECGPLKDLSIDPLEILDEKLQKIAEKIESIPLPSTNREVYELTFDLTGNEFPSVRFGLEGALLDLYNGGNRMVFINDFIRGKRRIPINGLIWMGDLEFMKAQAQMKPGMGYGCLKMKIGALDFERELEVIKRIRAQNSGDLVLRLDANGAFTLEEAFKKFERLKEYNIHSVEQPLAPGQKEKMKQLCKDSPVPVALDEELIGINTIEEKVELLKYIQPKYIILKPTLVGGFSSCNEWISVAEQNNIGWWVTSALESNIGLNAIAQFAAEKNALSYQGLGTGQLYKNNFYSPLTIDEGALFYDIRKDWEINL